MSGRWSSCCCDSSCGPVVIQRMFGDRETLGTFEAAPEHFLVDQFYDTAGANVDTRRYCGHIRPGGDPYFIQATSTDSPNSYIGGADATGFQEDNLYTYIGVLRRRAKAQFFEYIAEAKMRIHSPAIGTIGYYKGTDLGTAGGYDLGQTFFPMELVSTEVVEIATDGYVDVVPLDPEAIGSVNPFSSGEETFSLAIFFPGIDPEFVPSTWDTPLKFPL